MDEGSPELGRLRLSPDGREEALSKGICLDCGGQWPRLYTHVQKHGSISAYLDRWKYPPRTKLMSDGFRAALREQGEGIWGRTSKEKRANTRKRLRSLRGHPRAGSFTKTGPGKTWEIVRLRSDGLTYQEIEKKLGIGYTTIQHRCGTLGFPKGRCIQFDFGQPFTWGALRRLRGASGFTVTEFASRVAISQSQLGRHPESQHVDPRLAKKSIAWREREVTALLHAPLAVRRREGYRNDSVLETFYPSLRSRHDLLIQTMPAIRNFLSTNPTATISDLADFLAPKAQDEAAHRVKRHPFRDLLLWLPQLAPSLEKHFDDMRRAQRIRPLVLTLLGSFVGAQPGAVDYVVKRRAPTILPKKLRSLLMLMSGGPLAVTPTRRGGRPKGLHEKTQEKLLLAACGDVCGLSKRQQRSYLYPGIAKELAYSNSKKFHRMHGDQIKTRTAQLTPDMATKILDEWRRKHPEAGASNLTTGSE